jgi:transposase InsO family protein
MRRNGIRARGKRRFRVSTTDSNHALPIAPNLLARNFTVARANAVWVGDMTYIPTREGWLYLAAVLDLFSRRIVGWSMGETIAAELACRALDMAWYSRVPAPGLIFHSDRGSQYASGRYTDLLAGHGIKASMSRKSNCWDNACSETLFGSLKVERLHGMEFKSLAIVEVAVERGPARERIADRLGHLALGREGLKRSIEP